MKKILSIILITIATSIAISSCTDEEITPSSQVNGGSGVQDPKP
jgi:hypothetical protein